ncbi:MAG TPA: hypothetical protein VFD43_00345, partial [Planctomycetota bacterium]|nr:hypothetical protein [Planctomycetota bacterium]
MTRGLRRTLVFLAMVAAGLAVVLLLADPFQQRRPRETEAPAGDDAARLKLRDQAQGEIQMVFGDVSFDVLPEDAAAGERPLYRVRIRSGRPGPDGSFRAEGPVITLLDQETGESAGELSADEAVFEVGSSVGGAVTIELGRMRPGRSELKGHVRGSLRAPDGSVAELACESLAMRDELVEAPGLVTWTRPDLSVSGYDLRWDGVRGRLEFTSGARLVLPPLAGRPGYDLLGPGGLTLDIPPDAPDARAAAHAELRGRVVGSSTDGRSLEADLLVLDGPTGTVTLTGDAVLLGEVPGGGARARLTAQRIVATTDESGAMTRAEAEDDVRLAAEAEATWLATSRLSLEGLRASSAERVSWGRAELSGAGTGFEWDLELGRLELLRETELSLAPETEHPLAGLRVTTPAGLRWDLPAGTGELDGPVHGSLPDGTDFDAERLVYAGAETGLALEGQARVRRLGGGVPSSLAAGRIVVSEAGGGATLLRAAGDVVLESGAPGAPPMRLLAQQLEASEGRLRCAGPVE